MTGSNLKNYSCKMGKLADDDLEVVAGQRDKLLGLIQKHYGLAKESADEQLKTW